MCFRSNWTSQLGGTSSITDWKRYLQSLALIKGYTEKQWGRKCTELPAFLIKRIPVRLIFNNNYHYCPIKVS